MALDKATGILWMLSTAVVLLRDKCLALPIHVIQLST